MKFFLDTEFIENGRSHPLTLISIGIVCADESLYLVSSEFSKHDCNDWVRDNVLPSLNCPEECRVSVKEIARLVTEFVDTWRNREKPEFWGYYSDYDWVVFCQLFGRMIDLPKDYP